MSIIFKIFGNLRINIILIIITLQLQLKSADCEWQSLNLNNRWDFVPSFFLLFLASMRMRRHFECPVSGPTRDQFFRYTPVIRFSRFCGENENRHCLSRTLLLFSTDRRRQKKAKRVKRGARPECTRACGITCAWETRARTLRCLIDWGWQTGQSQTPTRFPASTRCRPKIFTHDKGQETGKSATILFSRFFPLALSPSLSRHSGRIFKAFYDSVSLFQFIDIQSISVNCLK